MQNVFTVGRFARRPDAGPDYDSILVGIANATWLSALFWLFVFAAFWN